MALNVSFSGEDVDTDETFFLCSNSSWKSFGEYVKNLPDKIGDIDQFQALKQLVTHGTYTDTTDIASELSDCMEMYKPTNESVLATLEDLIDKVGVGDLAETITISED